MKKQQIISAADSVNKKTTGFTGLKNPVNPVKKFFIFNILRSPFQQSWIRDSYPALLGI